MLLCWLVHVTGGAPFWTWRGAGSKPPAGQQLVASKRWGGSELIMRSRPISNPYRGSEPQVLLEMVKIHSPSIVCQQCAGSIYLSPALPEALKSSGLHLWNLTEAYHVRIFLRYLLPWSSSLLLFLCVILHCLVVSVNQMRTQYSTKLVEIYLFVEHLRFCHF